ncbi:MAG: chorismate mutase [Gemmatimonadetes bacterium]|nr:chorismate mutase [Gemmatimonadota bacterium]MXX73752.1 chorismate mutase [Gemmatimonadota bacterium]MYC90393.1 chorismate mutase [Gemmatimonadota bacterium]MYG35937.1 chorismate mutase [Gemmatimonadota bacterium]
MWTGISVSDDHAARRDRLEWLRRNITDCDRELVAILRRRQDLAREIGEVKASLGVPVTDPKREAAVVRKAAEFARQAGLDEELIRSLIWQVMSSARTRQFTESGERPRE